MPKDKDAKAVELIGSPEKLIHQIIKDSEGRDEVLKAITQDGPPHKQIQHTLVLKRLEALNAALKKSSGGALKFSKGQLITVDEHGEEAPLPISIPEQSLDMIADKEKVLEKLSKGPKHEVIYTALLLQFIEAMIAAHSTVPAAQ